MGKLETIILIIICFAMSSCNKRNKAFFYSYDKSKCITFLDHPENRHWLYVIPGEYKSSGYPKSNYLIIKWDEIYNFDVKWSAEKYRFSYPSVIENQLDTSRVDFSRFLRDNEGMVINGKTYYAPPDVEGYPLTKILKGEYLEGRQKLIENSSNY
jgi:hypothetical protein